MNAGSPICPQCGAPLPRQASWRAVTCTYCSAVVPPTVKVVEAQRFHEAWLRAADLDGDHPYSCAGQRYRVIDTLGQGPHARVVLAERAGVLTERVVIKVPHDDGAAVRLRRESDVLKQLQQETRAGAAYFTQRLPQLVAIGKNGSSDGSNSSDIMVLRHPTGFWGSLAAARLNYPGGIDARHVVWMWRRVLEVLAYLHDGGWAHGAIHPDHLLVHPRDHGVLLIGWADATRFANRTSRAASIAYGRDLRQSAWAMRALLAGGADRDDNAPAIPAALPASLASLLRRASEDAAWCESTGAAALDAQLVTAAAQCFGAPRFIVFSPTQ
jgi:hypothetical protein